MAVKRVGIVLVALALVALAVCAVCIGRVTTARAGILDLLSADGVAPATTSPDAGQTFVLDSVSFGMGMYDVSSIEGEPDLRSGEHGQPDYYQKLSYTPAIVDGVKTGRASLGTLTFGFCFNKLWEVQLWSGYYTSKTAAFQAFDTWSDLICERYGDPATVEEAAKVADTDGLAYYKGFSGFDSECLRLQTWLVQIDGHDVRIDMFTLPSLDDYNTICYMECADYRQDLG